MSWGNVEWNSDCDSKLVEHLFGGNNFNRKKAKKKQPKSFSDFSSGVTTSVGKYVRIHQTDNNDTASSLNIKFQNRQNKKRKSSERNNTSSKKAKLNSSISTSNVSNEKCYNNIEKTSADENVNETGHQKMGKKNRKKKKNISALTMTRESKISIDVKNQHRGGACNEKQSGTAKQSINRIDNISKKEQNVVFNGMQNKVARSNLQVTMKHIKKETIEPVVKEEGNIQNTSVPIKFKSPYQIKQLKKCLKKHISSPGIVSAKVSPANSLREKMMRKLQASHFRYINEQLYNSKSEESKSFFQNNVSTFEAYHEGFRQQISQWPLNPLNVMINALKKKSIKTVIADFGCGEAQLAKSLPDHKVYSFDFVATCDRVTPCDMSNTPLETASVDIVVFCLSLMGSNLSSYIVEANRVLKDGGMMMIAEVESRFENVSTFIQDIKKFGFLNTWKDFSHKIFYFLYFKKVSTVKRSNKLPSIVLKSCLYKKR